MGRDPKRLGAQLGLTAVLHTWNKQLLYHPHVHLIVTGGGLSLDGTHWVATRPRFLLPVAVIRRLFRGAFLAALRRLYRQGQLVFPGALQSLGASGPFNRLLYKLYDKDWVVYAKPPFGGPEQVFAYLGRYTHRVGITSARLVSVCDAAVTFKTRQNKTVTVAPLEFIRRFLLHVLPRGFVKIRHMGLTASRNVAEVLPKAQRLARAAAPVPEPPPSPLTAPPPKAMPLEMPTRLESAPASYRAPTSLTDAATWQERLLLLTGIDVTACQHCGAQTLLRLPLPMRLDTS